MFTLYLKTAWRNISQKKGLSLLNIAGLSLGMAATILIGMWVYDELSFNKDFENYTSITQVMQTQTFNDEIRTDFNQPMQLAPVLRNDYGSYFKHVITSTFSFDALFTVENTKLSHTGNFAEPGMADMLSLKMISGSRGALEDPASILLSESMAKAFFGIENATGKSIQLGSETLLTIGGVYEDLPRNTSFSQLEFLGSWDFLKDNQGWEERTGWGNNWFQVFAQLNEGVDVEVASNAIANAKMDNLSDDDASGKRLKPTMLLHPLKKWHLYSRFENGINTGGAIDRVWLLGVIGAFILLLACINFMNLSTAQSVKRAKEVGIRKTIGSIKYQLISQFLVESLLVVSTAFVFALLLVVLAQGTFNEITGKAIIIPWDSAYFWISCLLFILVTSFLSGSYPAFYLSSFKPVKVLKGTFERKQNAVSLRKVLVVSQFAISTVLIIGTITIFKQIQYAQDRPLGYDKSGMFYFSITNEDMRDRFETLKSQLLESTDIEEVAASDVLVTGTFTTNSGFDWKGKDPEFGDEFLTLRATHDFGEMINWELTKGRGFSREFKSDSLAFLVNETAVDYMGLENPIGEFVQWGDNGKFKIIGVVKDMVTRSPYTKVRPTIFTLHYGSFLNYINVKVKTGASTVAALSHAEDVFKEYNPQRPFTYQFLDDYYEEYFIAEKRTGKLISFFTFLAIFISCLGIFGLSAFIAEQRTKEIGVRKVLGASVYAIWRMLSKDFILLVLISSIIAVPIGYYYMNNWIGDFDYNTSLNWWVFALAIFGALLITLITISFQAIKAAVMNPVTSLRTE